MVSPGDKTLTAIAAVVATVFAIVIALSDVLVAARDRRRWR